MHTSPATKVTGGFLSYLTNETKVLFSSTTFLLLIIVALHFSFWFPLLFKPMETELDAYARYASATYDSKIHDFFPLKGSVWLPLYSTLLAPVITFFPDSTFAPRFQIALVSSFTPIFLFLMTRRLVKQKLFALITALLYACLPLFTEISATTLTEPMFLSLFMASLYCFLTQRWKLWIIFMMACQALRFEAWFVIPIFIYAIVQHEALKNKTKLLLLILLCIFPALYSSGGLSTSGDSVSYFHEMADMAKKSALSGMWNWHEAVGGWLKLIPQIIPISYLFLALIGAYQFLKTNHLTQNSTHQKKFVLLFFVLPSFLSLMLPIQVFLHLRDWLPIRYLLIPATLAFPFIGLGIQTIVHRFSLKTYGSLYGLLLLYMLFELWSLKINTHRLMSTYSEADFNYLQNELMVLRSKVTLTNEKRITILKPNEVRGYPVMQSIFMIWFLMPQRPIVIETTVDKFTPLMDEPETEEIIIAGRGEKLPSGYVLEQLTPDHSQYQYFRVNKSVTSKTSPKN